MAIRKVDDRRVAHREKTGEFRPDSPYSDSPATSRASCQLAKPTIRVAIPFLIVKRCAYSKCHLEPVPAPAMELEEGKYPGVADWLDALDLDQEGLPRPLGRVPEPLQSISPPVDVFGIGEEMRCPELEVRSDVVQHPPKIAAVPRLVRLAHQLDVLRRHRLRSIPTHWSRRESGPLVL